MFLDQGVGSLKVSSGQKRVRERCRESRQLGEREGGVSRSGGGEAGGEGADGERGGRTRQSWLYADVLSVLQKWREKKGSLKALSLAPNIRRKGVCVREGGARGGGRGERRKR